MNFLFYGCDMSLNKYHTYKILCKCDEFIKLVEHTVIVLGVEITYLRNNRFMEFNFKTHLNKEKTTIIDFIKDITSTKKPSNTKHIIVIHNLDSLSLQLQYKLRMIIEKSYRNAVYICTCTLLSRVIQPLQSRFTQVRVPMLSNTHKSYIISTIMKYIGSEKDITKFTSYVKNVDMLQDVVCLSISYDLIDETDISKPLKKFKFVENEVKLLFTQFPKYKSTIECITNIRQFIYKIIHYNIDHRIFLKLLIKYCSQSKQICHHMHDIISIVQKHDIDLININQCKIIHSYEIMMLDIYSLLIIMD